MAYPPEHQKIVKELLKGGTFLLYDNPIFSIVNENHIFYKEFFLASFAYELVITNDYAYLTSKDSKDYFPRDFLIFLCALCYELNQEGKQVSLAIQKSFFDYDQVDNYLKNSVFNEAINSISNFSLDKFLKKLERRNIIEFLDSKNYKFKFTVAVKVFLDCAIEISYHQVPEMMPNEILMTSTPIDIPDEQDNLTDIELD
jgi:hypothetical protein